MDLRPAQPVVMVAIFEPPPAGKPQPILKPERAWFPGPTDKPFRVRPWFEYGDDRPSNFYFTNEMEPPCIVDSEGVHPRWTKPIIRWDYFDDAWQKRFEQLNSFEILDHFVDGGYGWFDAMPKPTDPYSGEMKYATIDCSLNLRNASKIHLHNGTKYVEYQAQDYWAGPNPAMNWEEHPQLMIKQVQAVRTLDNHRTSYQGDIIWDWMSAHRIALPLSRCWIYPGYSENWEGFRPYDCLLDGYLVTVQEYAFSGSSTYVRVTSQEIEEGWYQADGQNSQGDEIAKTAEDYWCRISGVNYPGPTPPHAGWSLGRQNLTRKEDKLMFDGYKTIAFFVLTLVIGVAGMFGFVDFQMTPEQAEIYTVAISVIGLVLRFITKAPVFFKKK